MHEIMKVLHSKKWNIRKLKQLNIEELMEKLKEVIEYFEKNEKKKKLNLKSR
jgi:thymidylate synthase ThyX